MCCGLVGVCCFFVWGFCWCCCWGFFVISSSHITLFAAVRNKRRWWYCYISPALFRSYETQGLIQREGLAQAEPTLAWPAAQVGENITSPGMSLQLVLAGDPGYQLGFLGPQQPPRNLLSALKEWQKRNSWLAKASPIPQVPGIKTL